MIQKIMWYFHNYSKHRKLFIQNTENYLFKTPKIVDFKKFLWYYIYVKMEWLSMMDKYVKRLAENILKQMMMSSGCVLVKGSELENRVM